MFHDIDNLKRKDRNVFGLKMFYQNVKEGRKVISTEKNKIRKRKIKDPTPTAEK